MNPLVVTAPTREPVSLDEARQHLRVDTHEDDAYIASLVTAAREACELATGQALPAQRLEYRVPNWPRSASSHWAWPVLELPRPPIREIVSVTYETTTGADQVVDPGDYVADLTLRLPTLAPRVAWPAGFASKARIVYDAGYSERGMIPRSLVHWMLLWVGAAYENREAGVTGTIATQLPGFADVLLEPHKVYVFA